MPHDFRVWTKNDGDSQVLIGWFCQRCDRTYYRINLTEHELREPCNG
jgi:hypothetical protein